MRDCFVCIAAQIKGQLEKPFKINSLGINRRNNCLSKAVQLSELPDYLATCDFSETRAAFDRPLIWWSLYKHASIMS